MLNEDDTENNEVSDRYYRARIPWALHILKEYAVALRLVRASGATLTDTFNNGM